MELHRKVEKVPSVLSDGTSLEEWKRRLIKSSIATVEETQVFVIAVRRGEARDLHTAFLVFQLFDSCP